MYRPRSVGVGGRDLVCGRGDLDASVAHGQIERVALQAPQVQADVRDVVPAAAVVDVAHVSEVRGVLERRAGECGASRRRARRRTPRRCAGGGSSTRVSASRSKYSTARAPHPVTSRASCSSTAAVPFARRYAIVLATRPRWLNGAPSIGSRPADAEQVADVRHDPLLAGLDEPVVVEALDVGLEDPQLLLDDRQQRAQLLAALARVARAVDGGQQPVEVVASGAHRGLLLHVDGARVDQEQLGRRDGGRPRPGAAARTRTCSSGCLTRFLDGALRTAR